MPRALEVAIREAVAKRGVSVLVLPGDVALQPAGDAPPAKVGGLLPAAPVVTPSRRDLERLAALPSPPQAPTATCGPEKGSAILLR
jgi:pyruvate dehydrogenase (quinone)